jgi:hypothetical protein
MLCLASLVHYILPYTTHSSPLHRCLQVAGGLKGFVDVVTRKEKDMITSPDKKPWFLW